MAKLASNSTQALVTSQRLANQNQNKVLLSKKSHTCILIHRAIYKVSQDCLGLTKGNVIWIINSTHILFREP